MRTRKGIVSGVDIVDTVDIVDMVDILHEGGRRRNWGLPEAEAGDWKLRAGHRPTTRHAWPGGGVPTCKSI